MPNATQSNKDESRSEPSEQVAGELQEHYKQETGEDLPEHVVENYSLLYHNGPTFDDIDRAFENGREAAPENHTNREMELAVGFTLVTSAIVFTMFGIIVF